MVSSTGMVQLCGITSGPLKIGITNGGFTDPPCTNCSAPDATLSLELNAGLSRYMGPVGKRRCGKAVL